MWVESRTWRGMLINEDAEVVSLWRGVWNPINPFVGSRGYYYVRYPYRPGRRIKRKNVALSRLVMDAFYGPSSLEVDHKDENKSNNRVNNLDYVTSAENKRRYWSKRTKRKSLSRKEILDIVATDGNILPAQLAETYKVSEKMIERVLNGWHYTDKVRNNV